MISRLALKLKNIPRVVRFASLACALAAMAGGIVYSQGFGAVVWDAGDIFVGFDNQFGFDVNPGHYTVYDGTAADLTFATPKDDVSLGAVPSYTAACTIDATSPTLDLWTVGFWDNVIRQFPGTAPHSPATMTLDMSALVGTNAGGLGAVTSIAFAHDGTFYVSNTYGKKPQIFHYAKPATSGAQPTLLNSFTVSIGNSNRGVDWIDLSADQSTLYYVANSDPNGLPNPPQIFRYDLVNSAPLASIPLTRDGGPVASFVFSFRVLPPGDGTGGFVLGTNGDAFQVDQNGAFVRGFAESAGLSPADFIDVNVSNDGKYLWTAAYPEDTDCSQEIADGAVTSPCQSTDTPDAFGNDVDRVTTPSQLFEFYIPTGTQVAGPLPIGSVGDTDFADALCVKREYAPATEQPLVQCPGDYRCSPPPTCPGPSAYCVTPGVPVITALVDNQNSGTTYPSPASGTLITNSNNDTVNLQVQATSGLSNVALTYAIRGLPPGLTYGASTGLISGVVSNAAALCNYYCQYTVSVRVTNASGLSVSTIFHWDVFAVPGTALVPDQFSQHGEPITPVPVSATDATPAAPSIFSLTPALGLSFSPTVYTDTSVVIAGVTVTLPKYTRTANIQGTPQLAPGVQCPNGTCPSQIVTLFVDDNSGNPRPSQSITFKWTLLNQPPVVTKPVPPSTPFNVPVTPLPVVASDRNGDALIYSLLTNPTSGLVINPTTGVITGTLARLTPYTVTVTADDGHSGTASQTFTWTPVNTPPTIVTPLGQTSPVKIAVTPLQVSASDVNGDTLTYSLATSPVNSGLVIDATTGIITGASAAITTYTVTVTVNDGHTGGTATKTFTWAFTNTPPTMVQPPNQTSPVGVPVTPVQISASDPDGDTLTYSLTTAPANSGLVISATGLITGTPTTLNAYQVTVTANDGHGGTASRTFTSTIVNTPPTMVPPPDQTSPVKTPITPLHVTASDPNGDTLTYSLVTSPANSGLVISATTGVISGTPTTLGPYQFTVTVSDGHSGTASQTFMWTFVNTPPTMAKPADRSSRPNVPVSLQFVAVDPNGDALTYSFVIPPGSGFVGSSTGLLTGSPAVGVYPITVTADDGHGGTVSQSFTWTVIANSAPVCTAATASPSSLWPPDHRFVTIGIKGVTDPNGDATTITINRILQDESTTPSGHFDGDSCNGHHHTDGDDWDRWDDWGSGNTSIDGIISGPNQSVAQVRAERDGTSDGRVYEIRFTASDPSGNTCTGTVFIGVPHDQGGQSVAVDSLVRYDSTVAGGPPLQGPGFNVAPKYTNPGDETTNVGKAVTLTTIANDINLDTLTYAASGLPAGLTIKSTTGVITGTPTTAGVSTVTLTVSDPYGGSGTAAFKWTIVGNRPPVAGANSATISKGSFVTISVLANDSDPDGDSLKVISVQGMHSGTAVINSNGTITYKPSASFTGTDQFTYTISDGRGGSATGSISVLVSTHKDGDKCDHDLHRNGHYDGDGCEHDRAASSHH